MFEKLFATIIEISITTSIVIALLLVISPIIKNTYAAKWRYLVWLILAIRLIIPLNFTLQRPPVTLPVPNDTIVFSQPMPTGNILQQIPQLNVIPQRSVLPELERSISLMEMLTIAWLAGIAFFILYHLITYIAFGKQVKRWSSPILNHEVISIFDRICSEFHITRKPQIQFCKKVSSPMMFGFVKPVLLLPGEDYSVNDIEVILSHELVHFKRKDLWYKLILLSANAIHWFNPFVYFMYKMANSDVEFSCDNEVIKNSDIAFRNTYSQTILATLHNEKIRQSALSTYFHGGNKTLKDRFENIFDMGKKKKGIAALCFILVLTVISGVFVACRNNNLLGKTDSELLYESKTPYVGNNSKVGAILKYSFTPEGLTSTGFELQTSNEPYAVIVNYEMNTETRDFYTDEANQVGFLKKATIMYSLIDNVGVIHFNLADGMSEDYSREFTRDEVNSYFGTDVREFAKTREGFDSFLEKVGEMTFTQNENTPMKGLELYVWKNRDITNNDDTYFTLLTGTNRNKEEDEIYDLSIAIKDINKLNELLAAYSAETHLIIYQMNTTDFTKDEMIAISDKIIMPANDYSKSIGLYGTTASPSDVIPVETTANTYKSIDEAIHDGLVGYSSRTYLVGEFSAEGHVIIDRETEKDQIKVYAVISTTNFVFTNGFFTDGGGSGPNPVVITLSKNEDDEYSFLELKEPMDGGMWEKSLKEMYPERLWDSIFSLTKLNEYKQDISKQIESQALQYLKSIGRNAEIKAYGDLDIKFLDIDENAKIQIDTIRKYDGELNKFPYWIGTSEWIENGIRYTYETYQYKSMEGIDMVRFIKTDENGTIISHFGYKIVGGEVEKVSEIN